MAADRQTAYDSILSRKPSSERQQPVVMPDPPDDIDDANDPEPGPEASAEERHNWQKRRNSRIYRRDFVTFRMRRRTVDGLHALCKTSVPPGIKAFDVADALLSDFLANPEAYRDLMDRSLGADRVRDWFRRLKAEGRL